MFFYPTFTNVFIPAVFHAFNVFSSFHYIATPNIGGDIPIDVHTNQNIGGDTSPASPAGLTPMETEATWKHIQAA